MPEESQNGNNSSRLDRLEGLMELLMDDHLKFQQEHRQLLTAQVLLTDRVEKLADTVETTVQAIASLAETQKHTDERLNALIHVVDDWIRRHPPQQAN